MKLYAKLLIKKDKRQSNLYADTALMSENIESLLNGIHYREFVRCNTEQDRINYKEMVIETRETLLEMGVDMPTVRQVFHSYGVPNSIILSVCRNK